MGGWSKDAYDPLVAPDPEEWLSLDEGERLLLVVEHHRQAGERLADQRAHAAVHAIVENQIAEGDALPTRATLDRLMGEGLDRHDAVHAVGSVIMGLVHDMVSRRDAAKDIDEALADELRSLSAAKWLEEFG